MNTPNTEITLWIEFRRLVLGLPSVVIATGAIFLVTQEHRTRADLIGDYQWAAATAMRGQDWDKADVYYRKLAWLHETDVATQYGLALVAEQQGDHDRARGLMSDIAPDDSAGFGPAHFWLARDLVRRTNRQPAAPNVLETLERHLLRTVERQPDHTPAHVMLGRFYGGQGRVKRERELFEKAAWHLAKVTPGYPEYRLELAALYRILGNAAQAESLAEASVDHFRQELDADRNDIEARLGLAAAQVFLHRFSEALGTLEDGPDPRGAEPIRKALVATWLAWANALDPAQESLVGKRLELLQQAIQLDPENPIVLNDLAHLTKLSGPAADKARGELKDVLATGRAPAVVHLTLGSIAIEQQKLDQAECHLNQAFEMSPRMPEVLNNLAWVVARADPPQLSRALDLADMAVKLRPRHVEMRETRGQILFQLGRHQESLEDLLIALRQLPGRTGIHVTLAAIYEQLGDDEMAERHRRRASDSKQVGGAREAGKRPNEKTE